MAVDLDEVDENFDLKAHVEAGGFTEYDKIADAIKSQQLTLDDILECNETELKDVLSEYGIKTVQKNRFVKAIKKLPNSKMNVKDANTQEESKTSSADLVNSGGAISPMSQKILSDSERLMIDEFSTTSDKLTNFIIEFKQIQKHNSNTFNAAKNKLTALYNNAMNEVDMFLLFFLCTHE